jgi:hypothetical protein
MPIMPTRTESLDFDELRESVPFEEWRKVLTYGRSCDTLWNDGSVGSSAHYHGDQPNDTEYQWFRDRGYLPYVEVTPGRTVARLVPMIYSEVKSCFHTTPDELAKDILAGNTGILPGAKTHKSTTGRAEAARHVHVSLTPSDARQWASLLNLSTSRWTILRIDLRSASLRIFRDPRSLTGYIVDGDVVPRDQIERHSIFKF